MAKNKGKDFYTGCGKKIVFGAIFARDNKLAIALHELSESDC